MLKNRLSRGGSSRKRRNSSVPVKDVVAKTVFKTGPSSSSSSFSSSSSSSFKSGSSDNNGGVLFVGQGVELKAYLDFWYTISSKSITELIEEIGQKIVEFGLPDKKHMNASGPRDHALRSLCYCLDYVELFLKVDVGSTAFVTARAMWDDNRGKLMPHYGLASNRFSLMMSNVLKVYRGDKGLVNYALVDSACGFEGGHDDLSRNFPVVFSYIRQYAHLNGRAGKDVGRELYMSFTSNFLGMLNGAKRDPTRFASSIMNLLHVLCELLVLWPPTSQLLVEEDATNTSVLGRIRDKIQSDLLMWPLPYAGFIARVLDVVQGEMEDPGFAQRQRLVGELRAPSASDTYVEKEKRASVQAFYSSGSPEGALLGQLCTALRSIESSVERKQNLAIDKRVLENFLLLGTMWRWNNTKCPAPPQDAQALSRQLGDALAAASAEETGRWLGAMAAAETADARSAVLKEIAPGLHARADFTTPSKDAIAQQNLSTMFYPSAVPPCDFLFVDIHDEMRLDTTKSRRVLVIGDNKVVHQVVCSYVQEQVLATTQVVQEFYLIPVGRNDIAAYLALNDTWYRKHVYTPFASQLCLSPPIDRMGKDFLSSDYHEQETLPSAASPLQVQYTLMSDYVQGAGEVVAINIYECQCWREDSVQQEHCDVVVPFVTGVDIGLNASVDRYAEADPEGMKKRVVQQRSSFPTTTSSSSAAAAAAAAASSQHDQQAAEHKPQEESEFFPNQVWGAVLGDKHFIKSGIGPGVTPEIAFSLLTAGLDGQPGQKMEMPPTELQLFRVKNARGISEPMPGATRISQQPYEPRTAAAATPQAPCLEISWIAMRTSTNFLHEMIKKREKKPADLERIADTIRSEQQQVFGLSVDLRSNKQPFMISADQKAYGPFYRVRIQKSKLQLPVKTFCPV